MNNPLVLKGISIVAFIISALFTIMLMTSGTVGFIAWVLTVGMAIILESAKCGFLYESLTNTKLLLPIRALLGFIALLLVASSIFASGSYVQNQANKTKNKQLKESSQFKQLEQGKAVQQDLYNTKKKEIDDLKALQEQQRQEGEKIINSMPKNYIDRRNQQRVDTQSQVAKTQDLINQKSTELSQIGANLQSPIDTSTVKINSDNGYTAMFKGMADMINDSEDYKNNPIKAETLEMWFFIGLGIIFELVAVLTAYLAQLKGKSVGAAAKSEISTDSHIGFKPQVISAIAKDSDGVQGIQLKRKIGFDSESLYSPNVEVENHSTSLSLIGKSLTDYYTTDFQCDSNIDTEDLKIYLGYMYQNQKEGISPGYMSISKNTPLTVECCRKIKGYLERLKIIETNGSKTSILKYNWNP